jgi:hypothetical protein
MATCIRPFGNGKTVKKSKAIGALRKLANNMDRLDMILNVNLNLTYVNRPVHETQCSKVFMGFDSAPLYALPEWLDFQTKDKGKIAPVIDNMLHHSPAGILSFMTESKRLDFSV